MAFYSNQPLPDTNARQAATTIRPSSTALLTIDSEDRYVDYVAARTQPTTPYNFAISKTESMMPGFMTRLGISEIQFPWVIPNINDKTYEVQFLYTIAPAATIAVVLTLSRGFYKPSQLAAAIQAAVLALPGNPVPTFTMTYGQGPFGNGTVGQGPFFTYISGAAGTQVGFAPFDPNTADYPYSATTKQLFDILGFNINNETTSFIGTGDVTYCQTTRYIDIVCNQLTNSQAQKDQTSQRVARDMLCRLYVSSAPSGQSTITPQDPAFCPPGCAPTTIYHNYAVPIQIQWQPNQNIPGYLQFQVYDDSGDLLDLSIARSTALEAYNFADWSMTLLISEC
jgi:hypothetical protein